MADLTVYEKPTCTTCRNLVGLLTERGVDFERVNYHLEPLTADELRELVRKTGEPARNLMQRPVVERGDRALLARPVERALELLD